MFSNENFEINNDGLEALRKIHMQKPRFQVFNELRPWSKTLIARAFSEKKNGESTRSKFPVLETLIT